MYPLYPEWFLCWHIRREGSSNNYLVAQRSSTEPCWWTFQSSPSVKLSLQMFNSSWPIISDCRKHIEKKIKRTQAPPETKTKKKHTQNLIILWQSAARHVIVSCSDFFHIENAIDNISITSDWKQRKKSHDMIPQIVQNHLTKWQWQCDVWKHAWSRNELWAELRTRKCCTLGQQRKRKESEFAIGAVRLWGGSIVRNM